MHVMNRALTNHIRVDLRYTRASEGFWKAYRHCRAAEVQSRDGVGVFALKRRCAVKVKVAEAVVHKHHRRSMPRGQWRNRRDVWGKGVRGKRDRGGSGR
jgi:hypothetical protein